VTTRLLSTSPSRRTVDFDGADLRALILDAETDRLRLPDDSETRCLREHDAAVDFVLVAGNQCMQRG
jgi:hypothetical protein